jgi:hypothetical protein
MEPVTKIFISYSRRDEEMALSLYGHLFNEGYKPWMDVKDILPGENFKLEIERAIHSADFFIACLSSHSVNERGLVQSQIQRALSISKDKLVSDIYLIPVRFEECEVPEFFQDLQMADLFKDAGITQLLMAIKVGLERRRGTTGPTASRSELSEIHAIHNKQLQKVEITKTWIEKEQGEDTLPRIPWGRSKITRLPLVLESEHFFVHFGVLNPPIGKGLPYDGVRDRSLVSTYLDAFERCYETLTSKPWARQPPIVGPRGKTVVYVMDSNPFASYDLQMVPFICIPSRHNEPTTKSELDRAAAEAVHEVVHLFNYRERPFHNIYSALWEWYDCALASFIETIILPENYDYLRFVGDWIRLPEIPLDDASSKYQAFMFIHYLANRIGLEFINNVWTQANPEENPFAALSRMLPAGQSFASHDPDDRDIFASGYCMDSYFFGDPSSDCYMPQAYARYGERAVSESFLLDINDEIVTTDKLDHLSCRYYRFSFKDQANKLHITLFPTNSTHIKPLKAEIAVVTSKNQRGFTKPARVIPSTETPGGEQLFASITLPSEDVDHVVLVVSNCGLKSSHNRTEHDDEKEFTVRASAI